MLIGLGLALAAAARMVVQVRRTGDTGFRAPRRAGP
jgi:hypothetical protein